MNRKQKGFTLMELIVVIAIIAVLMLILVPTMGGFVNQAKQEANVANAKAVYTAVMAQNTAASSGLKDKDGDEYETVGTAASVACNTDELLHTDFYEDATSLPDSCLIKYSSTKGYTVEYEGVNYPNK